MFGIVDRPLQILLEYLLLFTSIGYKIEVKNNIIYSNKICYKNLSGYKK